jgi:hypothetical protein
MATLLIKKETGGYFSFVVDGNTANKVTNMRNDVLAVGNICHFKTANGANIIKTQNINVVDITLIASGTFTFATVALFFAKLIDVGYYDWLLVGGAGTGIDRFDELLDTFPYFGKDGQAVRVNESQQKLEPFVIYNYRNITDLEDTYNVGVPNKMLRTDIDGKVILADLPTEPQQFLNAVGYFDYNDLETTATPLVLVSNVEKKLTNDTLGSSTRLVAAPYGVSSIWNSDTNQFDFTQLSIDDTLDFRIDCELETQSANQTYTLYLRIGVGTVSPVDIVLYRDSVKTAASLPNGTPIIGNGGVYIGNSLFRDAPAEIYIKTDGGGKIQVNGWYVRIFRKDINIVSIQTNTHNDLSGLNVGDYQHLTQAQKDLLLNTTLQKTITSLATQDGTIATATIANDTVIITGSGRTTTRAVGKTVVVETLSDIVQTISSGDTTHSPSSGKVFDDMALKVDKVAGERLINAVEITKLSNQSGTNTGDETTSTILTKIGDGTKINQSYLPSYVDDVLEYANLASFPATGESGKIYIAIDSSKQYRWAGSAYLQITNGLIATTNDVPESSTKLYVSPSEKSSWNGKEDSSNKSNDIEADKASTSKFGTIAAWITWLKNSLIPNLPSKTTLVDADGFVIGDSTDSNKTKIIPWINFKALFKTINGTSLFGSGDLAVGGVGGTGTLNTISKWSGTNTQSDTNITDTGSLVTVNSSTTITAPTLTGSTASPALNISQSWNTAGNPTAILLNITNTASGANANLMDLQFGGVSQFKVTKGGTAGTTSYTNFVGKSITTTGGSASVVNAFDAQNSGAPTTGISSAHRSSMTFNPTSGSATFNSFYDFTTINQAIGAIGVTRTLYGNPTLTRAEDYRFAEWANNTGKGLWQTGTAPNSVNNLRINTFLDNGKQLQVSGNASITGTITASPSTATNEVVVQSQLIGKLLDEGNGVGTIFGSVDRANYGNIGVDAFDFSYSGTPSTTFGATGEASVAFGTENISSQYGSFSHGYRNSSIAAFSTTYGRDNINKGYASFVHGAYNTINDTSTLAGADSFTSGQGNITELPGGGALGVALEGRSVGTTIVGQANASYADTASTPNSPTQPMFIVGNGDITVPANAAWTAATRSDALIVRKNGEMSLPKYGDGTITGTATYALQVDVNGKVIEGALSSVAESAFQIGGSWINRKASAENNWTSITYGNGLFVAVAETGVGNRVMTSPDSVSWTSRTSAADNNWKAITYGNGLFVAVAETGVGNRVMTSSDGITWTSRTSAADNNWKGIAYGNGLFVAVSGSGSGNRVMTSPDGITWTSRSSAADQIWTSITYGNGLFVAAAGQGGSDRIMTSPDGVTWTLRTSSNLVGNSIVYGNGLFVVVGSITSGNKIITSTDGITWTPRSSGADSKYWTSVAYSNGMFVALSDGDSRVTTSTDGITWTAKTISNSNTWTSIAYNNGVFVGVSSDGNGDRVMTMKYLYNQVTTGAPASATSFGITNDVRVGADGYIYFCIAPSTWVRSAAATW